MVFWPVWYHLFENHLSEFVLIMLIRFLIQLRTIIVDYIFYSCHQKKYTCIKIMLKIWFSKFWRVMSAKKVKLKIWYTTKPAQKKPLVIVLLLFYDELFHWRGKVKNEGTIFSLINYPINFILTLKNVDYQCANIISWLLFWKVKNTVDNLQNIIFWRKILLNIFLKTGH